LPSQHPAPPRPPPQLIAGLIQAAGRPACKLALRALGPQVNYILHGDPLAEPHDYADPTEECEARHCLTADDLRKIDEGRAAEWAAAQPVAKVAPIFATHPRPDLALTLSLSSPAYMLIKHSLAPSIPSLYPRPCSCTAPSRRQPFGSHKRYRHKHYLGKGRVKCRRRSLTRYSGASAGSSPEWPPLGCARSEGCSAHCLPCPAVPLEDRQAGRQTGSRTGMHRQARSRSRQFVLATCRPESSFRPIL